MSGIMNMFVATKTTIATAVDAFFNSVSLLLNTSSTNGAQNNTFLDSSTNNFTITRNGNTTQGTFTPFSQTGWGNYFNGSSDYLSLPSASSLQLTSANPFTMEAWIYPTAVGVDNGIISKRSGATIEWQFFLKNTLQVGFYPVNGAVTLYSGLTVALNTWSHVAISWDLTTLRFFINGVLGNTFTTLSFDTGINTFPVNIGANGGGELFTGHISNARFIKGTAVYTAAFTPPTTPLTAITNTSLLTCQSNRFVDNSASPFTITPNGTPSVQAFSPFAPTAAYDTAVVGGSGYFVNATDYLSLPANSVNVGANDFSLEAWIYPADRSNSYYIFGGQSDRATLGGSSYNFLMAGSTGYLICEIYIGGGSSGVSTTSAPPINAWSHVVFSRTGGTVSLFLNGVRVGTRSDLGSSSINTGSTTYLASIAANGAGSSTTFSGYISNLRFIIGSGGVDATQSTITIPTALQTNVTNTKLLSDFTNAGIYDSAAKNDLITVGNAQASTTQAKWGTTSMYFDGTGDSLSLPSSSLNLGSGDFTIEAWIYATTTARDFIIGSLRNADGAGSWQIMFNDAQPIRFFCRYNGGTVLDYQVGSGTFPTNQWVHLAVTRSGANLRVFQNGTQVGTTNTTLSTFSIDNASTNYYVGSSTDPSEFYTGYIDDLRITKGYARYTANFTAPTAAFPLQ